MIKNIVEKFLGKQVVVMNSIGKIKKIKEDLYCVDGEIIGTGQSDYTKGATTYNLEIEEKQFALIDIPGIEGDESVYEEIIKDALEKAHAIFYVNGSGKKIEKATLEKIRKYMHDGTSVYAIFNVHCKAKKERIEGIDKTYSEELLSEFKNQKEIIKQTEKELFSFLGDNFKGSISVNGLLSFCAMAYIDNKTTIINDKNKNIRTDQKKYLKEYVSNLPLMIKESHITEIDDIIKDKVEKFDNYIYEENVKKLKNRLDELIKKIEDLKCVEGRKIKAFIRLYNEFDSNCYNAKEDFIHCIRHVGYNAVEGEFLDVEEELYEMIERDGGKTSSSDIEDYFETNKEKIIEKIQLSVNKKMVSAQQEYKEALLDAQQRLLKDFEREQTKFEVMLDIDKIKLDVNLDDVFKYNLKDFGGHLFTVGSLAFSGAGVGTLILPGLGTAIGAGIGAVLGVLSSVWNFFVSEQTKIDKAKVKVHRALSELIDKIANELKSKIGNIDYEKKINDTYEQMHFETEKQKNELMNIESLLDRVLNELKSKYEKIQ